MGGGGGGYNYGGGGGGGGGYGGYGGQEPVQEMQAQPQGYGGASQPLPDGWVSATDGNGRPYYYHEPTKRSQWEPPTHSPALTAPGGLFRILSYPIILSHI